MMNTYRVQVIEKHTDVVWVTADNAEDAERQAISESLCQFDCLHDCIVELYTETDDE